MTQALVIIDMWDKYHSGYDYLKPYIQYTTTRIAKTLDKFNGPVILACYDTDGTNPWTAPHHLLQMKCADKNNRLISYNTTEIENFLEKFEIKHLYYAGASLPGCIENRPIGINSMKSRYNYSVVIDLVCNLATTLYNINDIIHESYRYAVTTAHPINFSEELYAIG